VKEITYKTFDDEADVDNKKESPIKRRKTADIRELEDQYQKDLKMAKQNSLTDKHYAESEVRFRKTVSGRLSRRR
jgi:hypothetical protein